jgi:hypothetical protein
MKPLLTQRAVNCFFQQGNWRAPRLTFVILMMRVGDAEVRVQKTRHIPGPASGDAIGLSFAQPHWYPVD